MVEMFFVDFYFGNRKRYTLFDLTFEKMRSISILENRTYFKVLRIYIQMFLPAMHPFMPLPLFHQTNIIHHSLLIDTNFSLTLLFSFEQQFTHVSIPQSTPSK